MAIRGDECVFGELPPNVFKPTVPTTLVQALPPSPSPSRPSPGDSSSPSLAVSQQPRLLNPTYEPELGALKSGERSSGSMTPLTPRTLQERRAELALKVDGVLRETNDAQSRLAAQDARLGFMQQGLMSDSATPQTSQKLDQLRQHINDLRTIVMQDGSRVPGALQHVQRMLRLLAGQANAVDGEGAGRDVMNSIDVLSREVSQLIDLAAKGERTAGEFMTIRRTLEDLQQDVKTVSRTSSPAAVSGRSLLTASPSPRLLSKSSDAGELADLRAKVLSLASECERAVGDAAAARREVLEVRAWLQRALGPNQASPAGLKAADYSDELAACSSGPNSSAIPQRLTNGEADAAMSTIRDQMQILTTGLSSLDIRLKETEAGLKSMASSKELEHNFRQEVFRDIENLRSKVQTPVLANLGQAGAAELVQIGLSQLREVGQLADVLGLSSIIAASQGEEAPAVLASQVEDLRSEVTRIGTTLTRSKQATDDVIDGVNKMKEHLDIDQRFLNLRKELQGAIAELRVKSFPATPHAPLSPSSSSLSITASKSDFAALREGLNNLKLKHSVPHDTSGRQ